MASTSFIFAVFLCQAVTLYGSVFSVDPLTFAFENGTICGDAALGETLRLSIHINPFWFDKIAEGAAVAFMDNETNTYNDLLPATLRDVAENDLIATLSVSDRENLLAQLKNEDPAKAAVIQDLNNVTVGCIAKYYAIQVVLALTLSYDRLLSAPPRNNL